MNTTLEITTTTRKSRRNTNRLLLREDYAILVITSRTYGVVECLIDIDDIADISRIRQIMNNKMAQMYHPVETDPYDSREYVPKLGRAFDAMIEKMLDQVLDEANQSEEIPVKTFYKYVPVAMWDCD